MIDWLITQGIVPQVTPTPKHKINLHYEPWRCFKNLTKRCKLMNISTSKIFSHVATDCKKIYLKCQIEDIYFFMTFIFERIFIFHSNVVFLGQHISVKIHKNAKRKKYFCSIYWDLVRGYFLTCPVQCVLCYITQWTLLFILRIKWYYAILILNKMNEFSEYKNDILYSLPICKVSAEIDAIAPRYNTHNTWTFVHILMK